MADNKQQKTTKKPKPAPSPPDEEQKDDKKKPSRDNKGRFVKGHKKEGGRQLGTKNKFGNIRDRLKEQLEPILQELAINLLKIQKEEGTSEMLKTAEKYMPYCWPKLSSMSLGAAEDRPISEEERLLELDAMYTKIETSINIKTMKVVNNDKPRNVDDEDEEDDFDISQFETVEK